MSRRRHSASRILRGAGDRVLDLSIGRVRHAEPGEESRGRVHRRVASGRNPVGGIGGLGRRGREDTGGAERGQQERSRGAGRFAVCESGGDGER